MTADSSPPDDNTYNRRTKIAATIFILLGIALAIGSCVTGVQLVQLKQEFPAVNAGLLAPAVVLVMLAGLLCISMGCFLIRSTKTRRNREDK